MADTTKDKIVKCAKNEFLKNGFSGSSLRNIARCAGVTTGAIYGYFKDKHALFKDIVHNEAEGLYKIMSEMQEYFFTQDINEQISNMGGSEGHDAIAIIEYIYDNLETFKLVICHSKGTEYYYYADRLSELEEENTHRFILGLKDARLLKYHPHDELIHMICSSSIRNIFEVVEHDMDKENALEYVRKINDFYKAGWEKILFSE